MTGMVFWITGLPGSGKTSVASVVYRELKKKGRPVIFLDGDLLREIFGGDLGYDPDSRRRSAGRNSRLCKALSDQGIDVICATVSLFHSTHNWNRQNILRYREVFLKVPRELLRKRDQKGLYSQGEKGLIQNVVGIDIPFEEPKDPDLVLNSDGSESVESLSQRILQLYV